MTFVERCMYVIMYVCIRRGSTPVCIDQFCKCIVSYQSASVNLYSPRSPFPDFLGKQSWRSPGGGGGGALGYLGGRIRSLSKLKYTP